MSVVKTPVMPVWRDPANLSKREITMMQNVIKDIGKGYSIGTRSPIAMRGLESAGLVRRVTVKGMIADWLLTDAGRAWTPPNKS